MRRTELASAPVFAMALLLVIAALLPFSAFAQEATEAAAEDQAAQAETTEETGNSDAAANAEAGANGDTDSARASASSASASSKSSSNKDDSRETAVELDGETNSVDPTQRADNSFIYDTTIDSLFTQASLYEGRTVQVIGEAIGDIVAETPLNDKRCWVTLTATDINNPATISVIISSDQKKQIDHLGRYGVTGTILQVRGVYHQACSEHEGIAEIPVNTVEAIERGVEHPDLFDLNDFVPGIFAVCLGLVLITAYYIVRERTR